MKYFYIVCFITCHIEYRWDIFSTDTRGEVILLILTSGARGIDLIGQFSYRYQQQQQQQQQILDGGLGG